MKPRRLTITTVAHLDTGCGLKQRSEAGTRHPRTKPGAVEGSEVDIDYVRLKRLQALVVDAQSIGHVWTEIVDNDVHSLDQIIKETLLQKGHFYHEDTEAIEVPLTKSSVSSMTSWWFYPFCSGLNYCYQVHR